MEILKQLRKTEGMLNHEVRFSCDKDLKDKSNLIYNKYYSRYIKKSAFDRLVFEMGLSEVQKTINEEKERK